MIVVGGENLIDYVQVSEGDDLPVYKAIPGGSCYNVAIAAARQGQEVAYITPISKDSLGNILAHRLETCLLYKSPSPRDGLLSRMPSSA